MTVQEIRSRIGELQKQLAEVTDPETRADLLDELTFLNQLLREQKKRPRQSASQKTPNFILPLYYHRRPKSEKGIGSAGSVPAVAGTPTTQADR